MKTNNQNAFNKSKALVHAIIEKIGKQNKSRLKFMVNIFTLFMGLGGRYNFTNMSRCGDYSEQTYRNNFEKPFVFLAFNKNLILENCSPHRVIAFDPGYIPKSGKKTEHIWTFWSGTFRDAKQFAGLTHAQARSENKLRFHFNAPLTAVSIARAIYYLPLEKQLRKSFSMSNVKTLHLNKIVVDRIFSNLGLGLGCKKTNQVYWDALWVGKIAS